MTPLELIVIALILAVPLSSGVLFAAFAAVYSFKKLYDVPEIWAVTPLGMKGTAYVMFVLGLLANVYFNWTRGAWIFRESPFKTVLFTSRLKRHVNSDHPRRRQKAREWAVVANAIHPGHV